MEMEEATTSGSTAASTPASDCKRRLLACLDDEETCLSSFRLCTEREARLLALYRCIHFF
jgi:hypothetical protein